MQTFSLTRELEENDNAGCDTKWVYMEDRCGDTIESFGGGAERNETQARWKQEVSVDERSG